jgi:hypothetical protein
VQRCFVQTLHVGSGVLECRPALDADQQFGSRDGRKGWRRVIAEQMLQIESPPLKRDQNGGIQY